ncbi:hypothetical protein PM082_021795 [Marasmius tenuissimus]|nr:hypothetical protein PM082_021795 [Marasmius tenuissimus]
MWRTDVIQAILKDLPMEKMMFEAADPALSTGTFESSALMSISLWIIPKLYNWLRYARIWGKSDTFDKTTTFRP